MNQSLKKLCAMGAAMVTLSSCSDNSNSGYNDYNGPAPIKVQYSKDGPSRGAYSGYNQQPQLQPQYQQPQVQQQPQRVRYVEMMPVPVLGDVDPYDDNCRGGYRYIDYRRDRCYIDRRYRDYRRGHCHY